MEPRLRVITLYWTYIWEFNTHSATDALYYTKTGQTSPGITRKQQIKSARKIWGNGQDLKRYVLFIRLDGKEAQLKLIAEK